MFKLLLISLDLVLCHWKAIIHLWKIGRLQFIANPIKKILQSYKQHLLILIFNNWLLLIISNLANYVVHLTEHVSNCLNTCQNKWAQLPAWIVCNIGTQVHPISIRHVLHCLRTYLQWIKDTKKFHSRKNLYDGLAQPMLINNGGLENMLGREMSGAATHHPPPISNGRRKVVALGW